MILSYADRLQEHKRAMRAYHGPNWSRCGNGGPPHWASDPDHVSRRDRKRFEVLTFTAGSEGAWAPAETQNPSPLPPSKNGERV